MKFIFSILFFVSILYSCSNQKQETKINVAQKNIEFLNDSLHIKNGEALFIKNCAACHKKDQDYTGPALKGISQRWSSKKELFAYIKNAPEVIKSNAYARDLYKKWNESVMMPFEDLSDEDLESLLAYIEN